MKMSEEQFRSLLDRYVNNTASAEEREILDRFFKSYQSGFQHEAVQDDRNIRQEIFRGITARIGENAHKGRTRPLRLWLPLAAVISIFVLAHFFIRDVSISASDASLAVVETHTPPGQKLIRQLPDGTIVHLNSDSKISYEHDFGNSMRQVSLSGEAYFEVVKDEKPFVVHADGMRTEVLGTSFNVKSRKGNPLAVTLVEGSVNVKTASGAVAVLHPNEQALVDINSGEIRTREVNIMAFTSWKDNILFFERTSLKEAIRTLESWYAVKIDIASPDLDQCLITAKYQDEPLGNVLSSFQFLLNLNITRLSDAHYSITGTGCK